MRTAAKSNLKDVRGLLGGDATVARAALLNHVERIQTESDAKVYVAKGNWRLSAQLFRGGAGGQNRTGYARLFRAALYH
jgi:hypothetical protein